jgi:hypothetical protein
MPGEVEESLQFTDGTQKKISGSILERSTPNLQRDLSAKALEPTALRLRGLKSGGRAFARLESSLEIGHSFVRRGQLLIAPRNKSGGGSCEGEIGDAISTLCSVCAEFRPRICATCEGELSEAVPPLSSFVG